jgi:DNA-binding transcriptional ArsR family regulator
MVLKALNALAETTRPAATRLLTDGLTPCLCVGMRRLDAMQGRMSRHMRAREQAGQVTDRRDARWVRDRIRPGMPPYLGALLTASFAEETMA